MGFQKIRPAFSLHLATVVLEGFLLGCGYQPPYAPPPAVPADLAAPAADLIATCGHGNCTGCCLNGVCQAGKADSGCGASGETCRACVSTLYQVCLPQQQRCDLDPAGSWKFIVRAASVMTVKKNGQTWDGLNGSPDPYVKINGVSFDIAANNFSPQWSRASIVLTENNLTKDGVAVEISDDDQGTDEVIAARRVFVFQPADLVTGSAIITGWDQTNSVLFGFAKQ